MSDPQAETLPQVLTIMDVARWLRVSKNMAYSLAHRQDFPAIRVGRALRVSRQAFLRWCDEQAGTPGEGR
jgi:excisionase family DNA binding protein